MIICVCVLLCMLFVLVVCALCFKMLLFFTCFLLFSLFLCWQNLICIQREKRGPSLSTNLHEIERPPIESLDSVISRSEEGSEEDYDCDIEQGTDGMFEKFEFGSLLSEADMKTLSKLCPVGKPDPIVTGLKSNQLSPDAV